ncbi:MAG TPA: tetratricopeptide repeat protein, partial [Pyrinomonadaceae bacterium]|nr:tetratricopeptide repeat protein [Pyrinomonadaceae bacterium]
MAVKKSDSHFERRREYLSTLPEWRNLIEHFELNDHAFAYIPLLVPNDLWARVCEVSLESYLSAKGKHLYKIECQTPDDVKNIAVTLFDLEVEEDTEAIWVVAPIGNGESFLEKWSDAWREGMARLNQYRNPLKDRFPVTILFVGAQWIQEITRNMAPDLWSIRRTVIRLEPNVDFSKPQENLLELSQNKSAAPEHFEVDTDLVIRLAERIKGKKNSELELANLFYDLANGYFQKNQYQSAIDAADKAIKIYTSQIELEKNKAQKAEINIRLANLYFIKAYTAKILSNNTELAIKYYRTAINLDPNAANAHNNLGNLLAKDENRLVEAEEMYRTAIKLNPNDANSHNNLGILLAEDKSRWNEAETMYRTAIKLNPNDAMAHYNLGVLL